MMDHEINKMKVIIRKAERGDCNSIMELKKELALHQNMSHLPMLVSPQDLERDGFDTQPPFFYCLVAEECLENVGEHVHIDDKNIIGYGLYYISYPVWEGVGIVLEDLCVSSSHRGKGIGSLILKELGKIAVKENYNRITLEVKNSNYTAQEFYTKHLGIDLTKKEGWHIWKLDKNALHQLATTT